MREREKEVGERESQVGWYFCSVVPSNFPVYSVSKGRERGKEERKTHRHKHNV